MAKEVLKTRETAFSNRPQPSAVSCLSYPSSDFIFAEFGTYWKFMKKLSMSRLFGKQTLDQLLPIRREELRQLLRLMLKRANENQAVDVGKELAMLTINVISRMIVSKTCMENVDRADEIMMVMNETTEIVGKFNLSDYIWFCKNLDLQGIWKKSKKFH